MTGLCGGQYSAVFYRNQRPIRQKKKKKAEENIVPYATKPSARAMVSTVHIHARVDTMETPNKTSGAKI